MSDLTRTDVIKLIAITTKPWNLQGVNLEGLNLRGLDLTGANLNGVNLNGVNLTESDLSNIIDLINIKPKGLE